MSFRQDRTNPSTAVSNWRGRSETPKGWPSTQVDTWMNGGLFGGGGSGTSGGPSPAVVPGGPGGGGDGGGGAPTNQPAGSGTANTGGGGGGLVTNSGVSAGSGGSGIVVVREGAYTQKVAPGMWSINEVYDQVKQGIWTN